MLHRDRLIGCMLPFAMRCIIRWLAAEKPRRICWKRSSSRAAAPSSPRPAIHSFFLQILRSECFNLTDSSCFSLVFASISAPSIALLSASSSPLSSSSSYIGAGPKRTFISRCNKALSLPYFSSLLSLCNSHFPSQSHASTELTGFLQQDSAQ